MLNCMSNNFGNYLREQIARRRREEGRVWTQNELARRSGISSGGISMIVNGKVVPDAKSLKRIAKALKVSPEEIFEAAGVLPPSETELSAEVLDLAREIDDLPSEAKPFALRSMRSTLEAMYSMIGGAITEGYEVLSPAQDFARVMRMIERKDPEFYQELVELLNEVNNSDDPDT